MTNKPRGKAAEQKNAPSNGHDPERDPAPAANGSTLTPATPEPGAPLLVAPQPITPESLVSEPLTWSAMTADLAPTSGDDSPSAKARSRLAQAGVAVALVVVVGLLGFGLRERSNVAQARAKVLTTQRRNVALGNAARLEARQLTASQARVDQLNARVVALESGRSAATSNAALAKLVDAVPSVTDELRRCAGSALATASDALDYAAAFPTSAAGVNAAATTVATTCGQATDAANTLDGLADAAKR